MSGRGPLHCRRVRLYPKPRARRRPRRRGLGSGLTSKLKSELVSVSGSESHHCRPGAAESDHRELRRTTGTHHNGPLSSLVRHRQRRSMPCMEAARGQTLLVMKSEGRMKSVLCAVWELAVPLM